MKPPKGLNEKDRLFAAVTAHFWNEDRDNYEMATYLNSHVLNRSAGRAERTRRGKAWAGSGYEHVNFAKSYE